jgi:hypothetical protein
MIALQLSCKPEGVLSSGMYKERIDFIATQETPALDTAPALPKAIVWNRGGRLRCVEPPAAIAMPVHHKLAAT